MARMELRPRIGILQAEWPLQSQTFNCVWMLTEAGYQVDLFLYETPVYYDLDRLGTSSNLLVHTFPKSDRAASYARRTWKAIKDRTEPWPTLRAALMSLVSIVHGGLKSVCELSAIMQGREEDLIPDRVLQEAQALMTGKRYRCLIGIEKKGLIWAGIMGDRLGIPYIYYSLELYTWDHPESRRSLHARRTKLVEEQYHKKSAATIIQDEERAQILFRDNGVRPSRLFYVPVSLLGEPYRARPPFLHKRLQLPSDQRLILQFGQICQERLSVELAHVAQDFPKDWSLVLHGYGPDSVIRRIAEIDVNGRLFLSLDMVPSSRILELIASADIGLALYSSSPANDLLTAFSSEKVALYLQSGVPLIAFDYPGYRRLMDRYRCGMVISTLGELPKAVERILSSYEEFRSNAYDCFIDCYDFAKHFKAVIEGISNLRSFSAGTPTAVNSSPSPMPSIQGWKTGFIERCMRVCTTRKWH